MNYKFFSNKKCKYYPCHNLKEINCLFCYCPLYHMDDCGGNYKYTLNGIKDCSDCNIIHTRDGWDYVQYMLNKTK